MALIDCGILYHTEDGGLEGVFRSFSRERRLTLVRLCRDDWGDPAFRIYGEGRLCWGYAYWTDPAADILWLEIYDPFGPVVPEYGHLPLIFSVGPAFRDDPGLKKWATPGLVPDFYRISYETEEGPQEGYESLWREIESSHSYKDEADRDYPRVTLA